MPGGSVLQAAAGGRRSGHPAGTVIGRGREFHAELAGGWWPIYAQGTPGDGDLGDDAGSLCAKIMRYRLGNGLTGAIGEATEVRPGARVRSFRYSFGGTIYNTRRCGPAPASIPQSI